ncbi:MAG: PAS domain S-box protein [Deltaproteobacteria bacterium]|nr:PAS domain S-box protein [Deltaproteobacteria bacterium]
MPEDQNQATHKLAIYEKIFDNVDEEIMLLSRDLKILWTNKKVLTSYGLDEASVISESCHKVTHHIDHICRPPHDICPVEVALRTGKPTTVHHTHFDHHGNKIYVEVSAYPVHDDDGITEFIHISRNVTERMMAEERLREHQRAILELSTPVVKLWDGIITLPLIGVIDSNRAKQIMENLLEAIVRTQASIAVIDITGVPMVDTEVADRLIRTIKAAGLLGTRCILVGTKPDIAQSIVNLGIDLTGVETFSSLQVGLEAAFKQVGLRVVRA